MAQFALPGTATPADILSGMTASSGAGFNFTGTMPAQGSPTLYLGNTIPAGNYTGGSVAGVKTYSNTATSGAATSTFNSYGGGTDSLYATPLIVPSGANQILFVVTTNAIATPYGYTNPGDGSTVLCSVENGAYSIVAGGALSLDTSSIMVPFTSASAVVAYTIYYV